MQKVKTGLNGLNNTQFSLRVKAIESKLSNAAFKGLTPVCSVVKAKINEFDALEQQITAGMRSFIPQRNAMRKDINAQVVRQCDWINSFAGGDLSILEMSGFELTKKRQPLPLPGKVGKITLTQSNTAGEVFVNFKGIPGCKFHKVQMCTDLSSEANWQDVALPSRHACVVNGLTIARYTYFRVCAVNTAGEGQWSDSARIMVG